MRQNPKLNFDPLQNRANWKQLQRKGVVRIPGTSVCFFKNHSKPDGDEYLCGFAKPRITLLSVIDRQALHICCSSRITCTFDIVVIIGLDCVELENRDPICVYKCSHHTCVQ